MLLELLLLPGRSSRQRAECWRLKTKAFKPIKFNKIKSLVSCCHSRAAAVLTLKGGRKEEGWKGGESGGRIRHRGETAAASAAQPWLMGAKGRGFGSVSCTDSASQGKKDPGPPVCLPQPCESAPHMQVSSSSSLPMALFLHLEVTIPGSFSGAPITGASHTFPTLHYFFFVGTSGKTMEICSLEPPGLSASILSPKSWLGKLFSQYFPCSVCRRV